MNFIQVEIDHSDYVFDNFPNIKIDDKFLNKEIAKLYPGNTYDTLIPTLLYGLENLEEEQLVWKQFNPAVGKTTICPILMCPVTYNLSKSFIVAEIIKTKNHVKWNRLGIAIKKTKITNYKIKWLDKMDSLKFDMDNYQLTINEFKRHYKIDKILWDLRLSSLKKMIYLEQT